MLVHAYDIEYLDYYEMIMCHVFIHDCNSLNGPRQLVKLTNFNQMIHFEVGIYIPRNSKNPLKCIILVFIKVFVIKQA